MSPDAKAGQRPTGFSWQENLENRMNEEKQMTVRGENPTGASSAKPIAPWDTIDWPQVDKLVKRLQMRIAKAIREGRHGKAKALQWLLTHSFCAKLKAVKRVTNNTGAKTPGVDGVLWTSPKIKMAAAKSLKRKGYHPQPYGGFIFPKAMASFARFRFLPCTVEPNRLFICWHWIPSRRRSLTRTPMVLDQSAHVQMPSSSVLTSFRGKPRQDVYSKGILDPALTKFVISG